MAPDGGILVVRGKGRFCSGSAAEADGWGSGAAIGVRSVFRLGGGNRAGIGCGAFGASRAAASRRRRPATRLCLVCVRSAGCGSPRVPRAKGGTSGASLRQDEMRVRNEDGRGKYRKTETRVEQARRQERMQGRIQEPRLLSSFLDTKNAFRMFVRNAFYRNRRRYSARGVTLTYDLPSPFLQNATVPSTRAKSVWSLPMPTFSPGL